MKPKLFFFALLLVAFSTSAFSQIRKDDRPHTTVRFSEVFTALSINDNMTVVLTDGTSDEILIEGNQKTVDARLMDGHLYLGLRTLQPVNDLIVYVPAGLLSKVFVNGNGLLQSASVLHHKKLNVFLGGEGKINIRSTGMVTLEALNDISFVKGF